MDHALCTRRAPGIVEQGADLVKPSEPRARSAPTAPCADLGHRIGDIQITAQPSIQRSFLDPLISAFGMGESAPIEAPQQGQEGGGADPWDLMTGAAGGMMDAASALPGLISQFGSYFGGGDFHRNMGPDPTMPPRIVMDRVPPPWEMVIPATGGA